MTFPTLTTLVGLPTLAALALPHVEERREPEAHLVRWTRLVGGTALVVALGLALLAVRAFDPHASGPQEIEWPFAWLGLRTGPRLAVDSVTLPMVAVTILLALAGILGSPRAQAGPHHARAVLLTCSGTLLLQCAADLNTFVAGWFASLLPAWLWARSRASGDGPRRGLFRMLGTYAGVGSLALLVATFALHWASAHGGFVGAFPLDRTGSLELRHRTQPGVLLLLGIALVTRKGLFPFHSWVPRLVDQGSVALTTQLLGAHAGVLLLLRVILPLAPHAGSLVLGWLAFAAIVTAAYGALGALGQDNLRRCLGWVAVSQSSLILLGVAALNGPGLSGALLQCVGFSLAFAASLWAAHFLEVRAGTADMRRLGGLASRTPLTAGSFFVAGAALVGLPGSVAFVADELLVHGTLEARPWMVLPLLAATALNAITMYRAYVSTFLGRPKGRPRSAGPLPLSDLRPRERWVLASLLGLVLAAGVFPQVLIGLREPGVSLLIERSPQTLIETGAEQRSTCCNRAEQPSGTSR